MKDRKRLTVAVRTNADFAHSYFTRTAPSFWSVFPAGVCDSSAMEKAGWEQSVAYVVDGVEYEAFCKSAQCDESVEAFLAALSERANAAFQIHCPECGAHFPGRVAPGSPRFRSGKSRVQHPRSRHTRHPEQYPTLPLASLNPESLYSAIERFVNTGDSWHKLIANFRDNVAPANLESGAEPPAFSGLNFMQV